jgi:ubiquinone/menaquinone biosynthesis C-methylase UbiE
MLMKIAKIFDNANLYKLFQFGVSRKGTSEFVTNEILKPKNVKKVLDFGCGIGYHSNAYPESEYLGIEPLVGCIKKANALYARPNATFNVGDHTSLKKIPSSSFDLVIAIGVLHHVDDSIFDDFIVESSRILKPGGRLTTLDPVTYEQQKFTSRWMVLRDRGEWVRSENGYLEKFSRHFDGRTTSRIFTKLLRIPYDHIAIEAIKKSEIV